MKTTWFIKDGQITGFAVFLCIVFGIALAFGSIGYVQNYYVRMTGFSVGLAVAALGGYSALAYAIHLRPFGNCPWQIAKETYKKSSDKGTDSSRSD